MNPIVVQNALNWQQHILLDNLQIQYIQQNNLKKNFENGLFSKRRIYAIKKVDFSSMNAILDEVKDEELYNVIGGCGSLIRLIFQINEIKIQ